MRELDSNEIEKLLSRPKRGYSKKGIDLSLRENRNLLVWIKLFHSFQNCANPECPDDRPRKVQDGHAMCVEINGQYVCRLCFLAGFGLDTGPGV